MVARLARGHLTQVRARLLWTTFSFALSFYVVDVIIIAFDSPLLLTFDAPYPCLSPGEVYPGLRASRVGPLAAQQPLRPRRAGNWGGQSVPVRAVAEFLFRGLVTTPSLLSLITS